MSGSAVTCASFSPPNPAGVARNVCIKSCPAAQPARKRPLS